MINGNIRPLDGGLGYCYTHQLLTACVRALVKAPLLCTVRIESCRIMVGLGARSLKGWNVSRVLVTLHLAMTNRIRGMSFYFTWNLTRSKAKSNIGIKNPKRLKRC